tara:strand:+ start:1185 stop:1742 length:558 start_codon:yes stop_codon:yes gene_type:complete
MKSLLIQCALYLIISGVVVSCIEMGGYAIKCQKTGVVVPCSTVYDYEPVLMNGTISVDTPAYVAPLETWQVVYQALKDSGVQHPEIVVSQSYIETGNYTKGCYNVANYFGLRYKGKNIDFTERGGWRSSVSYIKRWQCRWYDGKRDYWEFIKCPRKRTSGDCMHYCENPEEYEIKVKEIHKQLFR